MNDFKQDRSVCERCSAICRRFTIRTPADLCQAIRVVRDNIAKEIIVEIPSASLIYSEPFSAVNESGPWDDVIGYNFCCTSCGQLFSLSAETYRGSGGEWRPVTRL